MFGVFGTISRLDRERERKCQSLGFCSGEDVVVVLMIIIMTPKKQEKERKKKNSNIPHKP